MNLNQAIKNYFEKQFENVEVNENHYNLQNNNELLALGEIIYTITTEVTGYKDNNETQITATEELTRTLYFEFDYKLKLLTFQNLNNQHNQTKYSKIRFTRNDKNLDIDDIDINEFFNHLTVKKIYNTSKLVDLKDRDILLEVNLTNNVEGYLLKQANDEQIKNTVNKFKLIFNKEMKDVLKNEVEYSFEAKVDKAKKGVLFENIVFGSKPTDLRFILLIDSKNFKFAGDEIQPDELIREFCKHVALYEKNYIFKMNYQKEINKAIEDGILKFDEKISNIKLSKVEIEKMNLAVTDDPMLVNVGGDYLLTTNTTINIILRYKRPDDNNTIWTGNCSVNFGILSQYSNENMKHTFKLVKPVEFEAIGPDSTHNLETEETLKEKMQKTEDKEEVKILDQINQSILEAFNEYNDLVKLNSFTVPEKII